MTSLSGNHVTETSVLLQGLRQDLKEWEASFFAANNRKAGREDIKQVPEIGQKYKAYNELRHPSSKHPVPKISTPTKKRQHSSSAHAPQATATPNKRPKVARTQHPSTIDPYDPPISTLFSPPTHRTSIGPTPQKDGLVLGLFDNLSSGSRGKTPSKRASTLAAKDNVQATPSKGSCPPNVEAQLPSTGKRHRKSPLSASKQSYLNTYLTPSASRIVKNGTPSSRSGVSKLRFDDTPAFLRRDSQRTVAAQENIGLDGDISWSPVAVRKFPKAYAGKGLSALVKGLRDMEEEKLDEELDMLREFEDGDAPISKPQPKILVNDSQRPEMPLGPDGDIASEDEVGPNEGKGRDGRPLKVWKKKGQKRTTRKIIMRPNVAKWKPEPAWNHDRESEGEGEGEDAGVQETQVSEPKLNCDEGGYEDEELCTDDDDDDVEPRSKKSKPKPKAKADESKGEEGKLVKKVKKISATAHANFRALKIKNKQSKGKRGGRFGRKR